MTSYRTRWMSLLSHFWRHQEIKFKPSPHISMRSIGLSLRKTSTRRNLRDDGWEEKQFSIPNDLEIPTEMSEGLYRYRDGQISPLTGSSNSSKSRSKQPLKTLSNTCIPVIQAVTQHHEKQVIASTNPGLSQQASLRTYNWTKIGQRLDKDWTRFWM